MRSVEGNPERYPGLMAGQATTCQSQVNIAEVTVPIGDQSPEGASCRFKLFTAGRFTDQRGGQPGVCSGHGRPKQAFYTS